MSEDIKFWIGLGVGAGIAIIAGLVQVHYQEKRREKNELHDFYSVLISTLDSLMKARQELRGRPLGDAQANQDLNIVKSNLTTTTLPYAFNKFYTQFPREVTVNEARLNVRDLIYALLKIENNLESAITRDNDYYNSLFDSFNKLREWMEKQM